MQDFNSALQFIVDNKVSCNITRMSSEDNFSHRHMQIDGDEIIHISQWGGKSARFKIKEISDISLTTMFRKYNKEERIQYSAEITLYQ